MKVIKVEINNNNSAVIAYKEAFEKGYSKLSQDQKEKFKKDYEKTSIKNKELRDEFNKKSVFSVIKSFFTKFLHNS